VDKGPQKKNLGPRRATWKEKEGTKTPIAELSFSDKRQGGKKGTTRIGEGIALDSEKKLTGRFQSRVDRTLPQERKEDGIGRFFHGERPEEKDCFLFTR